MVARLRALAERADAADRYRRLQTALVASLEGEGDEGDDGDEGVRELVADLLPHALDVEAGFEHPVRVGPPFSHHPPLTALP